MNYTSKAPRHLHFMTMVLLPLALALSTPAQEPNIYFVPSADVESWCLAGHSCCLGTISPRDVAVVNKSTCQDCAFKLAPLLAWNTLVGDDDGDASYYRGVFGGIDALFFKRAPTTQPNMRQMFISPSRPLGRAVSGSPGLRPGDVGAILRNGAGLDGQVVHFLRVEQVRAALGLTSPINDIDIDAIAVSSAGDVFLSLDADHAASLEVDGVPTPMFVQDGAILVIPATAITYDARGNVSAVAANRGMVVFSEPQVDALVASSGITNHVGVCQSQIGDTDALEIAGIGDMQVRWGRNVYTLPHLAVGGESLTGLGVIHTAGGVMTYGPTPCWLARHCSGSYSGPSTGFEMGVAGVGGGAAAASLAALAFDLTLPSPFPFYVDTCTPTVSGPATVAVGVHGGNTPTLLLLSMGPSAIGGVAVSSSSPWLPTSAHPDIYFAGHLATVPVAGGILTLSIPSGLTLNVVMQAVTIDPVRGQPALSTPATLVLR